MAILTYFVDAKIKERKDTIEGRTLTIPRPNLTDGLNTTYSVNVDIGVTNQRGVDQSPNLVNMKETILYNVPLAAGSGDVRYADVGSPVTLKRSSSGQYEIVGFAKSMPGTYKRTPVDLDNLTIGIVENLTTTTVVIPYDQFPLYGGYGVVAYGARLLYKGSTYIGML